MSEKRVAITLDEQIDALKNIWDESSRISLSSGFNWHLIKECEDLFSFKDWNEFTSKIYILLKKLEELKKQGDGQEQNKED